MSTTVRYGYNGNRAGEQLLSFCRRARHTLIGRLSKPTCSILEDEEAWARHFEAIKRINDMDHAELRKALAGEKRA